MTHDDYLEKLETFTDGAEDVAAVLAHAESCAACRTDALALERALTRAQGRVAGAAERIVRMAAAAAAIVVLCLALSRGSGNLSPAPERSRTVVVGDASGVVAYTPSAVVIGTSARPEAGKEISR
jgi:hypothetical protein